MQTLRQQLNTRQQLLRQYWQQLSSKDRRALSLLAIAGGFLLVIYGALLPSYEFQQNSQQQYREQAELLHWLGAQKAQVASLNNTTRKREGSALSQINQTAKQHSLTIQRIQPQADDSIKVWLESMAFDNSVQWLEALDRDGVSLRELNISKVGNGTINFRGTFYTQ
jgi:general secretion pathway protein M